METIAPTTSYAEAAAVWSVNHPVMAFAVIAMLLSMTARILPQLAGNILGAVTSGIWGVTKQASLATVRNFKPGFTPRSAAPEGLSYNPKPGHTFQRNAPDGTRSVMTIATITDGQIQYAYDTGGSYTKYLAPFRYMLTSEQWKRVS